jgi:hypothetical protein
MSTKAGITQRWREYALGWGRVAFLTRTEKCRLPRRLLVPPAPPPQGLANDYHRHDHPGTPDQACDEDAVGRGHAGLRGPRCGAVSIPTPVRPVDPVPAPLGSPGVYWMFWARPARKRADGPDFLLPPVLAPCSHRLFGCSFSLDAPRGAFPLRLRLFPSHRKLVLGPGGWVRCRISWLTFPRVPIITTNRTFGEWNQIFADDAVAHAILDRLAERAEVFHLEGTSYRETHRRPASKVTPS